MNFLQQLKWKFLNFMRGRNGVDQLTLAMLIGSLSLQLIGSITGVSFITVLSMALYVLTLVRVFARKTTQRTMENAKFVAWWGQTGTKARQWFLRLKNSRQYKYFKCPQCGVLLRLKRGEGEKDICCPKCQNRFKQKS